MKFPSNLCKSIFKAYSIPDGYSEIGISEISIRIAFRDAREVHSLREICLKTVAQSWERNPRAISLAYPENLYFFLLELTASDLGSLTEFIREDLFWENYYKSKYGPRYITTPSGKWMQVFLEKNLQVWLEQMRPSEYEEETVIEKLELYASFVQTMVVHNFQPPPKHEIHHVPSFHIVLQCLVHLKTIDLSVNVNDAGDNFVMGCSNLSDKDIDSLASGVELCDLEEFRLMGTILNPNMAKRIGRALEKCPNLKRLHITDCSLGDNGVISFLIGLSPDALQFIEEIDLANNFISSTGAFQLAIVLAKRSIKSLNLRLNPIKSGICLLIGKLLNLNKLEILNFSACSLESSTNPSIAIMLCKMIRECTSLVSLNISVNNFSDILGWSLVEALNVNSALLELDVRNCNLSPTPTMVLNELILKNLKSKV